MRPLSSPGAVSAGQQLDIECCDSIRTQQRGLTGSRADNVSPDQVLVTNGSDEVLAFAWTAFLSDTDTAMAIPAMTYTFYPVWAKLLGQGLHRISMQSDLRLMLYQRLGTAPWFPYKMG